MLTTFIGMWLASFRITRLINRDVIFERWRQSFFLRFPPEAVYAAMERSRTTSGRRNWVVSQTGIRKLSWLGQLVQCSWCLSVWVSGLVVGVVSHFTSVPLPFLWWFATSAAVGLTARNLDG